MSLSEAEWRLDAIVDVLESFCEQGFLPTPRMETPEEIYDGARKQWEDMAEYIMRKLDSCRLPDSEACIIMALDDLGFLCSPFK